MDFDNFFFELNTKPSLASKREKRKMTCVKKKKRVSIKKKY